jgi:hypothetical protein
MLARLLLTRRRISPRLSEREAGSGAANDSEETVMRMLLNGLAAAFTLLFAFADIAAAERIECPLGQARRTITNDLPAGWWTTPIVNSLTATRVQDIGGKPALICVYGPAGSVQRAAPERQTCTASGNGFDCRPVPRPIPMPPPRPTPGPQTHSTGGIEVPQTYTFDLDAGRVGDSASADLWFQAQTASALFITPRNGATMALGDRSNRGRGGCASASYSPARVALSAIPVGSYVCVRTNEGRVSQFRMNAISPEPPKTLTIGYTAWR